MQYASGLEAQVVASGGLILIPSDRQRPVTAVGVLVSDAATEIGFSPSLLSLAFPDNVQADDFVSNAFAQSTAPVERPEFIIGERWVFRVIDLYGNVELNKWENKVDGLHDDSVRFSSVTLAHMDASKVGKSFKATASRSTLTFLNSRIVEGKELSFDFPLEVGKTWKFDYKARRDDGSGGTTYRVDAKVDGWEEVEVPAGKFKALKVTHSSAYSTVTGGQTFNGQLLKTYWYSPEAKRVVKHDYIDRSNGGDRTRTELVEYEVK